MFESRKFSNKKIMLFDKISDNQGIKIVILSKE
jgi:hypothetical protein